ncbi:HAD family hydrolase [Halococcus saccharolyticus]|uniref:HAD-superfamily hydrolase n=1 Tax=Halococcus saccharolyticus DSM 5350 TaxID=1227455 RepID=M0MGV0_9EURY|nr:HAD family hydrolase [Halococcus saccharolyticus]EMA44941.1 HAD-superfamily hydrolase [Halococcus saccharolyticus DSM 5350]
MTEYDAVLFDNDGILIEPPAHDTQSEATRAAFREVGVETTDRQHIADIVDGVTVERLQEICVAHDLDPDVFWEARERHDERSQFKAFRAGTRDRYDDVAAITDLPQSRGVVSNNHHSTVTFVLDFFDLRPLFDTHYGREKTVDSLRRKKPDPQYLNRALADLDAESALYVGDSESDVIAARRAGIDSVFVRRPHCRDVDLTATPTYEADDLHEIVGIVDG